MTSKSWRFGAFTLDGDNACLWRGADRIALRPKTFAVLDHLVRHAGDLVTTEQILDAVWPDTAVGDNVLSTSLFELRKLLGESAREPKFIETVHRRGYRFIAPVSQESASSASLSTPFAPSAPLTVVGREVELDQLQHHYTQALAGRRQIVWITGEAGIGKTTLVDTFVAQVANPDAIWISRGQCINHYGEGEPYLPLLEALSNLSKADRDPQVVDVLRQHGPSWLLQVPALLPWEDAARSQLQSPHTTRERMLRELAESVETLTAAQPLILVLEDLHWSDRSTLDWLIYMARRRSSARLLILGTYRPVDAVVRDHPVRAVTHELRVYGLCEELVLEYLSEEGVGTYLTHRFGDLPFSSTFCRNLHRRTNGNPLFLINVVNAMLQQKGQLNGDLDRQPLSEADALTIEIPETLRQFIEKQIQALSPEDQAVLEAASVAGATFSAAAVAAALEIAPETVEMHCDDLVRNEQFIRSHDMATWPDGVVTARYHFIHALYQESLYNRVSVGRRGRLHQRIGMRTEAGYRGQTQEIAAELARHFIEGRDPQRAVIYLQQAAENAIRRHAHQEAIGHLTLALEHVESLPEPSERAQHELALYTALAPALRVVQGPAAVETENAYRRARELCEQEEDESQLLTMLEGLCSCYIVRGEYLKARELGEQALSRAQATQDAARLLESHRSLGNASLFTGELALARTHLEAGIRLYDPQHHRDLAYHHGLDLGVICRASLSVTLWLMGAADQSRQRIGEAIHLAQEQAHPYSVCFALARAGELYLHRGEADKSQAYLERLLSLAEAHGFGLMRMTGQLLQGFLLIAQGQWETGVEQVRHELAIQKARGVGLAQTQWLARFAAVVGTVGQVDEGLRMLDEAFAVIPERGERWWEAELYRVRGELLLAQGGSRGKVGADADACFQQALSVARQQQARVWELRAAMSLSRLRQQQNKPSEAHALLSQVYDGFTEGLDTADLREAKALLDNSRNRGC